NGFLIVDLAECCMSHPTKPDGAVLKLELKHLRRDALLFGESQSRVVLSVRPAHVDQLLHVAQTFNVPAMTIGTVDGDRLIIEVESNDRTAGCTIDSDLDVLYDRWAN